jgi:adhesin/invasin
MTQQGHITRLAVATTAALVLIAGCGGSDDTTAPPLVAASVVATQGNAQAGTVGQALTSPVSVQVLAANGSPVPGVLVTWFIESGGGSVSTTSSTTDSLGMATVTWTLGTVAGTDSLAAAVTSASITLSAVANAGPVAALTKVSGDQQTVTAGTTSQPLVVMATDAYGNPVAGVTVAWIPENGGALGAPTTVTGSDGTAQDALTANSATTVQVLAELQADATIQATFTEIVD